MLRSLKIEDAVAVCWDWHSLLRWILLSSLVFESSKSDVGLLRYGFFSLGHQERRKMAEQEGCWEETPVFSSSHDALTLNNMSTKSSSIFQLNWVEKVSFDNLSHRKRSMFIVEASKMARLQPVKKLAFFSLFCRIATLICVVSSCFVRVWLVLIRSRPWDYPFGC